MSCVNMSQHARVSSSLFLSLFHVCLSLSLSLSRSLSRSLFVVPCFPPLLARVRSNGLHSSTCPSNAQYPAASPYVAPVVYVCARSMLFCISACTPGCLPVPLLWKVSLVGMHPFSYDVRAHACPCEEIFACSYMRNDVCRHVGGGAIGMCALFI